MLLDDVHQLNDLLILKCKIGPDIQYRWLRHRGDDIKFFGKLIDRDQFIPKIISALAVDGNRLEFRFLISGLRSRRFDGKIDVYRLLLADERSRDHENDEQREAEVDQVGDIELRNRMQRALTAKCSGHGK